MNDRFLYEARPPVRESFSQELFEKIDHLPQEKQPRAGKAISRVLIVLVLACIIAVSASPRARAAISGLLENFAGLWFIVTDDIEAVDTSLIDLQSVETGTLGEIRSQLPFSIQIPSHLTTGYVLQDEVGIASDDSWIMLSWEGSDSTLLLLVQKDTTYSEENPAPIGSVEELMIDNKPAALIRGRWDFNTGKWNSEAARICLKWTDGELVYSLTANNTDLKPEDLVEIYRSFQ